MKIAVDIRSLLSPTGRGVSHYVLSLLTELITQNPDDEFTLFQSGRRPYTLPPQLCRPNVTLVRKPWPNKVLNAAHYTFKRPKLDQATGRPNVFFAPNLGFVSLGSHTPLVLTVHDLAFVPHPEWFSRREQLWLKLVRPKLLVGRADSIIAISGQTKQELIDTYQVPEDKITVVHSGVDERYFMPVRQQEQERIRNSYGLPERYILHMGALEPRKNIDILVATWRLAREMGLVSDLVLAGSVRQPVPDEGGLHILGYVAEADKPALYAGATALVLLSKHEGFGFPPLEALACGTPSLVSDLPVFLETLGDACLQAPADSPGVAAEKLVHLEQDQEVRTRIISAGTEPLARLRWSACAAATRVVLGETEALDA